MSHHYSGPNFGFPRGDARLDFTDLYAFPKPGDTGKSILIMNAHPSAVANPPGPTTTEPFASEALVRAKIDTNGDAVADITFQVRFSSSKDGTQTATLRRIDASKTTATGNDGEIILEGVPVSTGRDARVTEADDYRFFAGWRSDPFFFDVAGALNNLQFTGDDFFLRQKHMQHRNRSAQLYPGSERGWPGGLYTDPANERRVGIGSKRIAVLGPHKRPFLPASKTLPISPGSRWTMLGLFRSSPTRWSTQAGIRRKKQTPVAEDTIAGSNTL